MHICIYVYTYNNRQTPYIPKPQEERGRPQMALDVFINEKFLYFSRRSGLAPKWEFPKLRGYLRVPLKGYYKGTIRVPLKGYYKGTIRVPLKGSVRVRFSEN